jgi:hypothetical protein
VRCQLSAVSRQRSPLLLTSPAAGVAAPRWRRQTPRLALALQWPAPVPSSAQLSGSPQARCPQRRLRTGAAAPAGAAAGPQAQAPAVRWVKQSGQQRHPQEPHSSMLEGVCTNGMTVKGYEQMRRKLVPSLLPSDGPAHPMLSQWTTLRLAVPLLPPLHRAPAAARRSGPAAAAAARRHCCLLPLRCRQAACRGHRGWRSCLLSQWLAAAQPRAHQQAAPHSGAGSAAAPCRGTPTGSQDDIQAQVLRRHSPRERQG